MEFKIADTVLLVIKNAVQRIFRCIVSDFQ